MKPVIEVSNLSKRYHVGVAGQGYKTFREAVTSTITAPYRRFREANKGGGQTREFWALRDVNFKVNAGDVVGIIGRNGAGKSTLLKILSRITKPTEGRVSLTGRIGSLLEVGTGFHPELTGRENIYLNGAILGMARREITAKFDDIVDFAEVGAFLDTPVKRYSSGMYVRLAFAVAAHLEPEILLVDEVLAVGDVGFQRKCLNKMGEVAKQGRTVFFVSHNLGAITRLCTTGIWLEDGKVRDMGPVEPMVSAYLASGTEDVGERRFDQNDPRTPGSEYIRPLAVRVRNHLGEIVGLLDIRRSFDLEIEYDILRNAPDLRIGLALLSHDGTVLFSSKDTDDPDAIVERTPGRFTARCNIPGDFLNNGQYFATIGADFPMVRSHFLIHQAISFRIEQTGGIGGHVADGRTGLLRMQLPWTQDRVEPACDVGVLA